MKKQNNILTYISKITYSVALLASLYACAEEDIIKNNDIEEGIPVELSINYVSPEMNSITTRGLEEDQEKQINDLYLFIFDSNGNIKDGSGIIRDVTASMGVISNIKTTSGKSLIYAIANVENNQQENLLAKLKEANTLEALNKCFIATTLRNGIIDVDRTSPNLVMSGAYQDDKYTGTDAGYCEILPGASTLSGKLNLIRLDSHIKFNIHTGKKVTKIEPKEWQVCNVPIQSFLLPQSKTNSGGATKECYANSYVYNNQTIHKEVDSKKPEREMHSFSFYQFENFKNAKETLTDANKREEEYKNDDKTNSGVYKHVEPCATSVEFKAYLELATETGQRIADIKITTLLGGLDPGESDYDFRNFNTWRNKKYTYNITINDVEDIVTEVEIEDETRPGIEGDVIDAEDEIRVLDAHYNSFNIAFTAAQVEKMSILVHSPFDQVEFVANGSQVTQAPTELRDYKWIKFKRTPNNDKTLLANYAIKNGGELDSNNERLDIFTLRKDVKDRAMAEAGGDVNKVFYYTVFVDEYYYTTPPSATASWGQNSTEYWKYFVNQADRYIMLIYTPQESADKESSHAKSRYFIKQKSIQTYYSTQNAESKTALGMEHTNESYKAEQSYNLIKPIDKENGFKNCNEYLDFERLAERVNPNWSNYASTQTIGNDSYYKTNDSKNTFEMQPGKKLAVLCLSRNRDKNGDGVINQNEMEWYVPTYKQLSGMYLGATSLPSPMFTPPSSGAVLYDDPNYHFMTSDNDKLWGQEGCSNSGSGSEAAGEANEMRCVRNLGITAENSLQQVPPAPYVHTLKDGHDVFDMTRMEKSNLRPIPSKALGFHTNFKDSRNRPYKKFELAKDFFAEERVDAKRNTWVYYNTSIGGKDKCADYAEAGDPIRGKGVWRTPNQRELLIIYNTLGESAMYTTLHGKTYGVYSCTRWEYLGTSSFQSFRIFGYSYNNSGGNMFLDNVNGASDINSILRCVRDIE